MPTYLMLFRFTPHGMENINQRPARIDAIKKDFQAVGAQVKGVYLVMGQYDTVLLAEAPNDETIAKLVLAIGAKGNVQTETLRAFTEEEYRKIVAALP